MKTALKGLVVGCLLVVAAAGLTFYYSPLWVNDLRIRYHLRKAHVDSKYVGVDGYTIHYFEARSPDAALRKGSPQGGVPLVLVHGLGSKGEDWAGLVPTLAAQGFHVYVPDLLGYGRSSKPDVSYSISMEEKNIVDFMQALKIERADVAGWSMGGWIALRLAVDYPKRVERLVVYDAAGVYFPRQFDASLFTPTDSKGVAKLSAILTPKPKPLPGFVSRAAVRKLRKDGWVIRRSVAAMTSGKDMLDFRLQDIHKPTLLVWGKQDQLIPLSTAMTMHEGIAGSSLLVVDGCGHLAPAECSRPVLKGTVAFLHADKPVAGGEKVVAGHP